MTGSRRAPAYRAYTRRDLDEIPQIRRLGPDARLAMKAVSAVLPFRVNAYVLDELVDWDRVPDDPMFQLAFPQRGMLEPEDFARMADLVRRDAPREEVEAAAREIQLRLNPHPSGQMEHNVPVMDGRRLDGMQHKYRETVLFFPSQGQTCHAYCTYCFRWAQFVGLEALRFAAREVETLVEYLRRNPDASNVLFTGGDPMVMRAQVFARYVEPLLEADLPGLRTVRIGTKSLAWWPHRFVTDPDADAMLRLFERIVASGKNLAFMAHFSHPRELEPEIVREAVRRVRATGAVIRTQAPLVRHVNDDPRVWESLWRAQVQLGIVPYYMFVERDTGPRNYFEVPLARGWRIFRDAYARVSGLGRTVRGPVMSATPGKVVVDGVADVLGERVFALRFLQARDPERVGRPFFAKYDPSASWFDQLEPAFGERDFFFDDRSGGGAGARRLLSLRRKTA